MESTLSISKGCFAFSKKRTKPSPRKKQKSKPNGFFSAENEDEDEDSAQERYKLYKNVWKAVDNKVEEIQLEFHAEMVKGVINILQNHCHSTSTAQASALRNEIPTIALVTGVNVSDHKAIFASLAGKLQERGYEYVANIKHKDGLNIKHLIQNLVSAFMGCSTKQCDSDEEDISFKCNVKTANLTLPVLASWYENESSNKDASTPKTQSPLIIIVENVEGISPNVIQDFVTICSGYVKRLPLMFIFGIPTTVSSIHRLLPQSVSRFLSLETLQAPMPTLCLSHIVVKVIMNSDFPFKLGFKTYRLLEEVFLYHDFSVLNFLKGIKFCMMEHYYENAFSLLCCPDHELSSRVNGLSPAQLEGFRQLPSCMKYVESCSAETQRSLLINDKTFKVFLSSHLTKFKEYHQHLYATLHLLHNLVSDLPTCPLGRQVREMYSQVLEKSVVDSQDYDEAMKFIRVSSRDVLMAKIEACLKTLKDSNIDGLMNTTASFEAFLDKLKKLDEVQEPEKAVETSKNAEKLKMTGRTEFLENLRHSAKKLKKPNVFEALRDQIIEFLDGVFRNYLTPPSTLPLFEVFYFDNVSAVKAQLMAAPRSSIHIALSDPADYLQCNCCEIEDPGTILPTMPDICIAYKLHLECGRLINLYDWLQAFILIANSGNNNEETDDKCLQARFVRAVSELQLLGFVTPTRKKTDHVARLTWGGC